MKEQHNELLKERVRKQVSLAEAERKYKEAMESKAQLENEKSDLLSHVNTLRASVQQLKEELSESCTKHDEIREREQEQEAHSILKLQYNPMTLTHNKQLLMVSLAEALRKYEEAKESNAKLENEKFNLKYHVHILRGSMQELEEMLLDAEMKYDAIKQEREQEQEAHNILKMQYKKMKETLTQCNELLMNHCIDLGSEEYAVL
ncbi:leucine-rich repeat flightless-interacting protein 2-like [Pangasianodon hypophthalmus]|uniref:leucine-rich repeat flightless-interacting protein 2-like n=1 Tax=Pangasianodon hypophthalmus TaxID=310915 RepID=UPI0023074143|nr:leucine-rich repeat flightless-interacting protein 2-like [Pangasianodon hypophthalmus]